MRVTVIRALLILAAVAGWLTAADAQERGPFTEPPRSVRTREVDVIHSRLELAFDWDHQRMTGVAVHTVVPFRPTKEIVLDAVSLDVKTASLSERHGSPGGPTLAWESKDNQLTLRLDREYAVGEELSVRIEYVVEGPDRGVHFVVPDADEPDQPRIVWTQCQPDDARCWFPCFDSPNERCTSEILATVPEAYFVLSNGVEVSRKSNGDGTAVSHWKMDQTHSPYLFSVVAGEFAAYEQSWDGIPIVSYVPPSRMADAERSFGKTARMVEYFSRRIGVRYPWPKYSQICCDEYGGGMEHTSATTLTLGTLHDARAHLDVSSDGLVAHELAHQWFGDLLTCKDWGEVWLNESFATFFATVWAEHDLGPEEAAWGRRGQAESYFAEDAGRYRRPIVTYRYKDSANMFDSHSYPKGARVLHMLRNVMGEDAFWKMIQHYTARHTYDVVETADLRNAVEETSGLGLNWFFDEWLDHGGHPEYSVDSSWNESEKSLTLVVRQTQKVDDLTPLFKMPVDVEFVGANGSTVRRITVARAEETFQFPLEERPRRVLFDPEDWILKKLTINKPREEWLDQLANDSHVMMRVQAVEALKGEVGNSTVTEALVRSARGDAFWAVRQEATKALAGRPGDLVLPVLLELVRSDPKSDVRRAAAQQLGDQKGDEVVRVLREAIRTDESYYVASDALRSLAKVAKDAARDDLIAALDRPSHSDVILAAAADELAKLGGEGAVDRLSAILDSPAPPNRRAAVLWGLARLKPDDPAVTRKIARDLDNSRVNVRQAAITALGESTDPLALELLLDRQKHEKSRRVVGTLDRMVEKLQSQTGVEKLRRDLDALREKNDQLESRLKNLEEAKSGE
jgi:aminopeptidase N